ncbi:MAG: hypothetical protein BIFFINMI_03250 [Phycisphaerae bacterium]|nr:hypothetical protein [Phycisphaerae bacterium]
MWAKNAAIDAAAWALGAAAVNLNVDHDLPHAGGQLAWPALGDGRLVRRGGLTLDHQRPFERQRPPAPGEVRAALDRLAGDVRVLMKQTPLVLEPDVRDALAAASGEAASFGLWFARRRAGIDAELGLAMSETMTSSLDDSKAFLLFAADLLARPEFVHGAYNRALATARRTTGHDPAPDLADDAGRWEVPLWTLRADAPGRGRLFAEPQSDGVRLSDDAGAIGDLGAADLRSADAAVAALGRVLMDAGARLRPRALTLTLFARLVLSNLFVHGIGGGRYDAATDELFAPLYGVPAPPMAVATATLRLPADVATATADQLRRAQQALRDMRANPQRHLAAAELKLDPAAGLVAAKWEAILRNQALRRTGGGNGDHAAERSHLFRRVHEINRDLASLMDERLAEQERLVRQLGEQREAGEVADARDFFYGLQTRERLEALRDEIRGRIG